MSEVRNLNHNEKIKIEEFFTRSNQAIIEPLPHYKGRSLEQLADLKTEKNRLNFWKFFSFIYFIATLVFAYYFIKSVRSDKMIYLTGHSYVIQTDLNSKDKQSVSQVEVTLPEHVYFVSAQGLIKNENKIKLPYYAKKAGKNRLPVVVEAEFPGSKEILVKFLNKNDEIIRESRVELEFIPNNI